MAKWGEGDPRWIVEERSDATNVNNWHWTERDVTGWSSDKLRELLIGCRVEGDGASCQLTDVTKIEGEASINNRKGKLIYFYEWVIKASWLGTSPIGMKYKGTLEVPNLSDENDMNDLDISVSLCKDEPVTPVLQLMKKEGVEKVRKALGEYVTLLKSVLLQTPYANQRIPGEVLTYKLGTTIPSINQSPEAFSQGMILPTAGGPGQPPPLPAPKKVTSSKTIQISNSVPAKTAPKFPQQASGGTAGVRIPTSSFSLQETFLTSPDELYRTFINQEFVQVFTHSAAQVDGCRGGKFQMLDGNVNGEFAELIPDEKIVMRWRFKTWPSEHYATISLHLKNLGEETELSLDCKGVPSGEEERTKEGWKRYYFKAIKQTFGYGASPY